MDSERLRPLADRSHRSISRIIGEVGEETAVADEDLATVAPTADVLSEQGAAPTLH